MSHKAIVFDGSLEEFLQIVYDSYYRRITPSSIAVKHGEAFFVEYEPVVKQEEIKKVYEGFKKLHKNIRQNFTRAFLSEEDIYLELFLYIQEGFKKVSRVFDPNIHFVKTVEESAKRCSAEAHKIKGYIRFEESDGGLLFAKIAPKHDVLPLIGAFFKARLGGEEFVIYDAKRKKALFGNDLSIKPIVMIQEPMLSDDEMMFKKAWATFFDAIAIKERENKALQRAKVPIYLRKYMSEFWEG